MLYMATSAVPIWDASAYLRLEAVDPARESVRARFTLPVVRFIGAHTGCSCGFPSVIAEQPIEYYDGMPLGGDDRDADLQSVRALLDLLGGQFAAADEVQLYPVSDGDEGSPAKGTLVVDVGALAAETFFFNERFLLRVRRGG